MTDLQIKAATLAEQERANREEEAIKRLQAQASLTQAEVKERLASIAEAQEKRDKATYPARFVTDLLEQGFGMYKDTSTGAANLGSLIKSLAGSIH